MIIPVKQSEIPTDHIIKRIQRTILDAVKEYWKIHYRAGEEVWCQGTSRILAQHIHKTTN